MIAPVDITNVRLETERLILRPWREADVEDFYAYASHPDVGIHAGWKPHSCIEESRKILNMFLADKKVLALELKETGRVIGSLGLEEPNPDPTPDGYGREIGYVLYKDYWGRGLMVEAVKAVIDYCFSVLRFDFLTCGHFLPNNRSRRVIEKCGFTYFGDSDYKTQLGTVEISKNYIMYNFRKER